MFEVTLSSVREAASEVVRREDLDRMLSRAGEYDKDACDEEATEYAEQLDLARALRVKQQREYRREVARARRRRFF